MVYLILLSFWQVNRMHLNLTEMVLKSEMKKHAMFVLFYAILNVQIMKPAINIAYFSALLYIFS